MGKQPYNDNRDAMDMLTPHFSLREMTASGTAITHNIDNTPPQEAIERMRDLCKNVLEPLRSRFGKIRITSGYRCKKLNKLVGGVPTSQHLKGEAADIHISDLDVGQKMYKYIIDNIPFDQVILEHRHDGARWIHVSYKK